MIGLTLGLGLSPTPVRSSGGGGGELFPDPDLQDTGDATNGWDKNGAAISFALGQIIFTNAGDSSTAVLVGSDRAEFEANTSDLSDYDISLTFANVVSGNAIVMLRNGTPVTFAAPGGGGVVTHTVSTDVDFDFYISGDVASTFKITHVSAVAA